MPQAKKKAATTVRQTGRKNVPRAKEDNYLAQHPRATREYKPRHKVHTLIQDKREPTQAACTVRRCPCRVYLSPDGARPASRVGGGLLEPADYLTPVSLWEGLLA